MVVRGGFITKVNEHYLLFGESGRVWKVSRLAALMVDDVDFVPSHELTATEVKRAEAVLIS